MTVSLNNCTLIADHDTPVAEILLVRVPPAAAALLQSDTFTHVQSGSEAMEILRLFRFRLLVARLDLPDMRPWELFLKARRAQARLQCVLLDERMTLGDEQRVRQAGGGAFASNDPAICAALVRSSQRINRVTNDSTGDDVFRAQHSPARAPP